MKYSSLQEAWGANAWGQQPRSSPTASPDYQCPASRGWSPYQPPALVQAAPTMSQGIAPHTVSDSAGRLKMQLALLYETEGLMGVLKVLPDALIPLLRVPSSPAGAPDMWSCFPSLDAKSLMGIVVFGFAFLILWDVMSRRFGGPMRYSPYS